MKGLFIGRFQPFHNGHLQAIQWVLDDIERLVIGIGSSEQSRTERNPFTSAERERMLRLTLAEYGERFSLVLIPDIGDDERWVGHVTSLTGPVDKVYANTVLESRLFTQAGYEVVDVPFFEREKYSATQVRELIASEGSWRDLLPEGTITVLHEISAEELIKNIDES